MEELTFGLTSFLEKNGSFFAKIYVNETGLTVKLYHLRTVPELEVFMSQDQRKEHRRHIIYYLQILEPETGNVIGRLVDITTIGIMIISERALEPGRELTLRIALPEGFPKAKSIDISGESVWCHKDVNPDFYAIGFRITRLEEEVAQIIEALIAEFGFVD